jgi:superfamily II DNA or RNA helicase
VILLDQTVNRIKSMFPEEMIGTVCGSRGQKDYAPITIATIGSVRKDKPFALTVCDEAHFCTQDPESGYGRFLKNQKLIFGLTATA